MTVLRGLSAMRPKTEMISFRVPSSLKRAIEDRSKLEGISKTVVVVRACSQYLGLEDLTKPAAVSYKEKLESLAIRVKALEDALQFSGLKSATEVQKKSEG